MILLKLITAAVRAVNEEVEKIEKLVPSCFKIHFEIIYKSSYRDCLIPSLLTSSALDVGLLLKETNQTDIIACIKTKHLHMILS